LNKLANRKLGRTTDIRMSMLRTLTTDLIMYGKITTTETRAKEVKKIADSIIALAVKENNKDIHILILLIDEIDKADLEFPNDLLWELDKMEFYINETKETVKAKVRPIVIITSNAEKELPDAFLRRCIFHYITFPDERLMKLIVNAHFENLEENLLEQAMKTFYKIRNIRDIRKKPSTSEFIDWIRALMIGGVDPDTIEQKLPYLGVLIKKDEDLETVVRMNL